MLLQVPCSVPPGFYALEKSIINVHEEYDIDKDDVVVEFFTACDGGYSILRFDNETCYRVDGAGTDVATLYLNKVDKQHATISLESNATIVKDHGWVIGDEQGNSWWIPLGWESVQVSWMDNQHVIRSEEHSIPMGSIERSALYLRSLVREITAGNDILQNANLVIEPNFNNVDNPDIWDIITKYEELS